ncbi:MAG TPA: UDP-N-acetylmuramoyl-L-alanyl-D-glutamate--2,6-diaminopimelate ligase [Bacillota bacterium]|nr:UDP-N-acetylmuramoyl-L-alanyl-D-glutamate--2,6-diaminopimelate ligase [Bacillota bacterium]
MVLGEKKILLSELAGADCWGNKINDRYVNAVSSISSECADGSVFVCIKGFRNDGHDFVREAYERGCRVFVCERPVTLPDDAVVMMSLDTRASLARLAAALYRYPSKELTLIGVTGTKGKTTVAHYIYEILKASGRPAALIGTDGAYIGTDGAYIGTEHYTTENTTPDSPELNRLMREAVNTGCRYAVMEVSSQAVMQHRVLGMHYKYVVFTNLSPDHISKAEHKNIEEYRDCKAKVMANADICVINADDENSGFMMKSAVGRTLTVSAVPGADYVFGKIRACRDNENVSTDFVLSTPRTKNSIQLSVRQPGLYSAYNASLAFAVCDDEGVDCITAAKTLAGVKVPGRFEIVPLGNDMTAIIDYAHNGASFDALLRPLRQIAIRNGGRLMCLFGSVGGKAEMRRAELADAAEKYCDYVFLTSDNPDREDPEKIIADIEKGFSPDFTSYVKIPDRSDAIYTAVKMLRSGDILVLAGKGNEDFQLINGVRVPFSEKNILNDAVKGEV